MDLAGCLIFNLKPVRGTGSGESEVLVALGESAGVSKLLFPEPSPNSFNFRLNSA